MSKSNSAQSPRPKTRNTWQKKAVYDALAATKDFVTAQNLHGTLQQTGNKVSLATVYRALQTYVDDGFVDVVPQPDGEALFRLCKSSGHHHHLVCRNCRATVEIEAPKVEVWADKVAAEHGYKDLSHTLEFFGLCPKCA